MNRLASTGENAWRLPCHAHLVVYVGDRPLLTIYRCGANESPADQLCGALGRVDVDHERLDQPTGSIVKLREPATLRRVDDRRFAVRR